MSYCKVPFYFFFCLFFIKSLKCLYVTDGSAIILEHVGTKYKLYSADMKWGSGSGNQLVTAASTNVDEDNLLWTVKVYEENKSITGDKINCNEVVTLKHVKSNGYLSGSSFGAVLSSNFELSVDKKDDYGQFQVICENERKNPFWEIGNSVFLKSVKYNGYVSTSKKYEFNKYNCHNCPILYHLEASIIRNNTGRNEQKWKAQTGVIISYFNEDAESTTEHDEL